VVVFAAAYLLRAVQQVFFNPLVGAENKAMHDATPRELAVARAAHSPPMVWMGLYPQPILRRTEAAARRYVETVTPYLTPGVRTPVTTAAGDAP
jgi:NADH:ubiquinone oxidoreductase subunit 4 (subunit M)